MLAIVNARGVPGAVGAITRDREGRRYLMSCSHVLFGGGARAGDTIWARDESGGRRLRAVARAAFGFRGPITVDGEGCFIDCAFAELDGADELPPHALALGAVAGVAPAKRGMRVYKRGWLTGTTDGIVADDEHFERPAFDGELQAAPRQLLIQPTSADERFSAPGESGTAVLDDDSFVVAVLWACNTFGEGIAFPAAAALDHFAMTVESHGASRARSHG